MLSNSWTAVRTLVKVFTATAFIAMILFGFSKPVAAKGPESVTISGPGIERPIELMNSDNWDLVSRLMEQTGLWYATGDLPRRIEAPAGKLGAGYMLTWINAGPPEKSVNERTMRQVIYLHAENGALIHTPDQETLEGWGPGVIGWFEAPDGLRDTLVEMGVPVSAASASDAAAQPGGPAAGALRYLAVAGFVVVVGLVGVLGVRRRAG